ncbi:MAG: type II secretion system F family protein, partial [Candidatus Baltobacteraceae bacterium]
FDRRVSALTAQGRASSIVLGALPPGVAALICTTQPALRDAVLHTAFGHLVLAVGLGLDALAVIVLLSITKVDA